MSISMRGGTILIVVGIHHHYASVSELLIWFGIMVPILLVIILDRGTEVHTEEDDSDESTSVSVIVDPPLGVKQQDLCCQLELHPELAFEDACTQSRFVDKGAECQICLEAFIDTDHVALLTPCYHGFHPTCLKNWVLLDTSCPICRGSIEDLHV
ncbi:hypothetical protein KP509_19G007200 [Ceratopteris richardii]|uniref:RING-type domain-containing protein n=1 Tax=Ceratopteris richardii TaxID=49495 RepID=A0A8T2SJU5_CERRI|nr:hypothetical protein KP509_19G007200 [Ceratopteris richardii]